MGSRLWAYHVVVGRELYTYQYFTRILSPYLVDDPRGARASTELDHGKKRVTLTHQHAYYYSAYYTSSMYGSRHAYSARA